MFSSVVIYFALYCDFNFYIHFIIFSVLFILFSQNNI